VINQNARNDPARHSDIVFSHRTHSTTHTTHNNYQLPKHYGDYAHHNLTLVLQHTRTITQLFLATTPLVTDQGATDLSRCGDPAPPDFPPW
jgi:hypothetical protein